MGIRSFLLLLFSISIMLILGILLHDARRSGKQQIEVAHAGLQTQAEATAADIDEYIRSAARLLYVLERIPEIRKPDETSCRVLDRLLAPDTRYAGGYVVSPNGTISCSSVNVKTNTNEKSSDYFHRAMGSGKVEVGKPRVCPGTGKYCFPLALALRNFSGQITSVLVLDLDAHWLAVRAATAWTNETLMVWWDNKARAVFTWPVSASLTGKSFTDSSIGKKVFTRSSGYFTAQGIDDREKVFGFATIRGIGYPDLKLSLGVPVDVFLAPVYAELLRDLALFAIVAFLTFGVAWVVSKRFLQRRVAEFSQIARRLETGDLGARFRKPYSADEFGKLAQSFDAMADALAAREARLRTKLENITDGIVPSVFNSQSGSEPMDERRNVSRLRTVVENLAEGVVFSNLDGQMLYFNRAAMKMCGISSEDEYRNYLPEEFMGTLELSGLDGRIWSVEDWPIPRILRGQILHNLEGRIRNHRIGWLKIFSFSGTLIKDNYGHSQMAVVILRDITESKQAEKTLRESEARFKTMFEQAPLGIALIDSLTGQICSANPMYAKIVGKTVDELANIDWMSITHPDDIRKDSDNMALLNAGKIPGFRMEKRYLQPDGEIIRISMTVAPIHNEDKTHPRHLCMIENITGRREKEPEVSGLEA